MRRFSFVVTTLVIGLALQVFLSRYFSLFGVSPQVLLLFVVAFGFSFGPILGETMGFLWGITSDAVGASLFGLNGLLFTLAGYIGGTLRRRVASERPTAQVVIALISTVCYGLGVAAISALFEEGLRLSFWLLLCQAALNALIAAVIFSLTELWIDLWKLVREPL